MAWSTLGIMLTGNRPHCTYSKHLETTNRSKLLHCGFIFPRVPFTSDLLGTLLQSQGTSSLRGLQDKVGQTMSMWNKVAAIFSHYNLAGAVFKGKFSRGVSWSFHVAIVIVYTLVCQDVWQGAGNTSRARFETKNGWVQKPCCLPSADNPNGIIWASAPVARGYLWSWCFAGTERPDWFWFSYKLFFEERSILYIHVYTLGTVQQSM